MTGLSPGEDAFWPRLGGPESPGGDGGTAWELWKPWPWPHTRPLPPPRQVKAIFLIMANCPGVTLTLPVSTAKAGLRKKEKG